MDLPEVRYARTRLLQLEQKKLQVNEMYEKALDRYIHCHRNNVREQLLKLVADHIFYLENILAVICEQETEQILILKRYLHN